MRWISYYTLYFISLGMSAVITLLALFTLPNEMYGQYYLFLSVLSFFTILTLGLQDYYRINFKDKIDYYTFRKMYNMIYKVQIVILIILLSVYFIFEFNSVNFIFIILILCIIPNNLALAYKYIYLIQEKNFVYYSIDFLNQIAVLVSIFMYLYADINAYIFFLIILISKILILIYLEIYNEFNLKTSILSENKTDFVVNKKVIGHSVMYILGFWLIVNAQKIDILYASNNDIVLGEFSQIKSIATLLTLLAVPVSNMFFIKANANLDEKEKSNTYLYVLSGTFLICLAYIVLILFINSFIDIMFNIKFLISYIMIVNFSIPINVYIVNLFLYSKRKLFFLGSFSFLTFLILNEINLLFFNVSVLNLILVDYIAISLINITIILKTFKYKKKSLICYFLINSLYFLILF